MTRDLVSTQRLNKSDNYNNFYTQLPCPRVSAWRSARPRECKTRDSFLTLCTYSVLEEVLSLTWSEVWWTGNGMVWLLWIDARNGRAIQEPLWTSFFPLTLCYRWDLNCFPVQPTLFHVIQQPCEYNNKERKLRLTTVKWLEKVTQPGKVRAKIQV